MWVPELVHRGLGASIEPTSAEIPCCIWKVLCTTTLSDVGRQLSGRTPAGPTEAAGTGADREATIWTLAKGNFQEAANNMQTKLSKLQVAIGQVVVSEPNYFGGRAWVLIT